MNMLVIVIISTVVMAAIVISMSVGLVARRLMIDRGQRRMASLTDSYREDVLELVLSEDLSTYEGRLAHVTQVDDRIVIANLFQSYSSLVRGEARDMVTTFAEEHGYTAQLIAELGRHSAVRRGAAARALGCLGATRASGALARLMLADPDERVRVAATRALGEAGAAGAAPAILEAAAAHQISTTVAARSLVALGQDALPSLVDGLAAADAATRELSCWALAHMGSGDPHQARLRISVRLERLVETDASSAVRREAVAALAAFADPGSLHAILTALRDDPSTQVRAAACDVAGRLLLVEFVPEIEALLDREERLTHPDVRLLRAAAEAIVYLGASSGSPSIFVLEASAATEGHAA